MTAFLIVWVILCAIGFATNGWAGPVLATGIMAVVAPIWFVAWAVNEGYEDHCEYSYNDC